MIQMKFQYYFFWFALLLLVTGCSKDQVFEKGSSVFKIGDQSEWATKNQYDGDWQKHISLVPDGQVFWSRTKIDILKSPESLHPYGIRPYIYGEYEVFWDGVLIGKMGIRDKKQLLGLRAKCGLLFVFLLI